MDTGREPGAGVGPCGVSLPQWGRGSVLRGHAASREVLLLLGAAELSCWLEAP